MIKRRKFLALIFTMTFSSAFIMGMSTPFSEKKESKFSTTTINKFTLIETSKNNDRNFSSLSTSVGIAKFLAGKFTIDELDRLFEEIYHPGKIYLINAHLKRSLLARKWGETAPRQGLEKLAGIPYGIIYESSLYAGWASKNPENALAFYEERFMEEKRQDPYNILWSILVEYATYSPEKAWEWLSSRESGFSEKELQRNKIAILCAVSQNNPELIPSFIEKTGAYAIDSVAYRLGLDWGVYDSVSSEWIDKLPEEIRHKSEAGRIMAITLGNLEKIKAEIACVPVEYQAKVISELASHILDTGNLDVQERIKWVIDSVHESEITEKIESSLINGMDSMGKRAKPWIDSLPPGAKKEKLKQLYNNRYSLPH